MESQLREKRLVAATSVGAAVLLTATKIIVGILTGSLGILAEAAHSALDMIAAIITLLAVRVSDRPADATHLYGHGKVENLSALAETMLLLVTCVWIIYEAMHRLFWHEVDVDPNGWAFLIMGLSIIVDFSRSRALLRVAKKYKSQALEADALHFSTDIWSSAVVIAGLGVLRLGEFYGIRKQYYEHADAIAALIVAFIVIIVSIRLGRRAMDALLDYAPKGLAEKLSGAVAAVDGILRVSRVRVRDIGSRIFVDLNVEVPRNLSLEESHQLTRKAQESVQAISPGADVVVHADPIAAREGVLEKIQAVAVYEHLSIHNVTTHWTERGIWIDLDLEVDPHATFAQAHELATILEMKLRAELVVEEAVTRVADINVHIEPREEESTPGTPLNASKAEPYFGRIEALAKELPEYCGMHKIELHELKNGIYLSFHLQIHSGISIQEVHRIAEEMEIRLRLEFPELGRIVIHTEPYS
jgi:cation diffusion facilitator family transporter